MGAAILEGPGTNRRYEVVQTNENVVNVLYNSLTDEFGEDFVEEIWED